MRTKTVLFSALLALSGFVVGTSAQTASPKASLVPGDVVSVGEAKLVIKTKDGDLDVAVSDKTEFKKLPPDNLKFSAAVEAAKSDVAVGDKVVASGFYSEDKKSLPARTIYLVSKSELAQKQAKENERWATRGISGRVSAVNTAANQVTIEVRGLMNTTNVVVSPKAEATYKRYKQDSVKYSEAVESSIVDVKPGDMLRAVGDRGADGTTFTAEEILTGAFQTVAGTVKSVDAAKNEIVVTQAGTTTDVTIALTPTSAVKRFPEEMAARMAGMAGGMGPGGQGGIRPAGATPAGQGGERPAGAGPGQGGPGGPGRGVGGPRGGIDDMFERFPTISIADLKPGDVIAVSSSKSGNAARINAIKLLAGVGPFLQAAQMQAAAAGGGRRGGGGQSFTIPGLDGFDN